jgi:hypothetical protein
VKKGRVLLTAGMAAAALAFGLVLAGCASILPMDNAAIEKYEIDSRPGSNFENFQYYVSRDIVLTFVSSNTLPTSVGQVGIGHSIIQVLSSTPGIVLEVKTDENGNRMLGVAFEKTNDNLLWFVQDPAKAGTYFYLAYTDEMTQEIVYNGYSYVVSYKTATGIGASMKRFFTPKKTKQGKYRGMEPILLYEETLEESERRKNLPGRRLKKSRKEKLEIRHTF